MTRHHAVVIGGSFAGLAAATALRETFSHVTVIDRDDVPTAGRAPRRGVPQSAHVHGIRMLGRRVMEELLPGFVERTLDCGAELFDVLALGASLTPHGWRARGKSRAEGFGIRRSLLEEVMRTRVLAHDNVTFVQGQAMDLVDVGEGAERRIGGAMVRDAERTYRLDADLVVDAAGRGSPAPRWLEKLGFPYPEDDVVNGFVGYASRWLKVPERAWPGDFRFVSQMPWPGQTKGATLYPQDNGLHILTLYGQSKDFPAGDEAGWVAFMRGCATPLFYEVWSRSEPVTEIRTSRSTANRWRHYSRVPEPPAGFLAVGDAVASFNPIFGQGVTCAVLAGRLLRTMLQDTDDNLCDLPRRFNTRLAEMLVEPWQTAVGFDLNFPATTGTRPVLTEEETRQREHKSLLARLSTIDLEVAETMHIAEQMFEPEALSTPDMTQRVKAFAAAGCHLPAWDPARPPALVA